MRVFLCIAFLLVALGTTRAADDADTLTLEGVRFRLDGIDAPELDQPCLDSAGEVYFCGRKANEELRKFIANRIPRCDDKALGFRPCHLHRREAIDALPHVCYPPHYPYS